MPTANFFTLIPTCEKKERESFRSRQNLIAVNLLRDKICSVMEISVLAIRASYYDVINIVEVKWY